MEDDRKKGCYNPILNQYMFPWISSSDGVENLRNYLPYWFNLCESSFDMASKIQNLRKLRQFLI